MFNEFQLTTILKTVVQVLSRLPFTHHSEREFFTHVLLLTVYHIYSNIVGGVLPNSVFLRALVGVVTHIPTNITIYVTLVLSNPIINTSKCYYIYSYETGI